MTAPAVVLPPPTLGRPAWHRRFDPLAVTSSALIANTAVTSVLGMAFWVAASRVYSARQLGDDAALISAVMLISVVSQLNLAMGISRLLPQVHTRRWRPVAGAYAVAAVVGLALAAAFVTIAPRVSGGFAFLGHSRSLGLAVVAAVVLWNVFALQDAVLTSARWAAALPVENGVFGVLKVGLMVVLAGWFGGHGIFVAWLLAMAVVLLPVNALVFGRVLPAGARACTDPDGSGSGTSLLLTDRGRVTRYLAVDHVAALFSQGYTTALPLLVVAVLGPTANAHFYVAFVIAGAVRAVAQSMSTSIVVEGAHAEAELGALARSSVRRYGRFAVPGIVVLVLAADVLLRPFGAEYVMRGTVLLRLLLAASVPQAVVALYLGVERVRARVGRVLAVEAATTLFVVVGVVVGMRTGGLAGAGAGWLGAQTLAATMVAPELWAVCRSGRPLQVGKPDDES